MADRWLSLLILTTLAASAGCRSGASSRERATRGPADSAENQAAAQDAAPAAVSRERIDRANALMVAFAERTGLSSDHTPRRYLWTDAFAVCNFLGLARATGDPHQTELAQKLIEQVHHTLGKHRPDDSRKGWISGLGDAEGETHPTRGGLRIGKENPERKPGERFDEELEWDRDGQYFHYLTKWMVALDQAARATRKPVYNSWARELALAAHRGFVSKPSASGAPRMVWKMSIDLTRPLVPSMGQHDPLDGFITYTELEASAAGFGEKAAGPPLAQSIDDFRALLENQTLTTGDPLGLGGLLADAYRVEQLGSEKVFKDGQFRDRLLGAALSGLQSFAPVDELEAPAERRLAFRELGLAIGLEALARMRSGSPFVEKLARYQPLAERIIEFWLDPGHQRARTWLEHRDINEVMLATALAPDGFLKLT